MDKIAFTLDDGHTTVDFYVLDQTRIGGTNYLLVADFLDEDAEALILKDVAPEDATESIYEIVDDDDHLAAVASVFEDNIGDIVLQQEE